MRLFLASCSALVLPLAGCAEDDRLPTGSDPGSSAASSATGATSPSESPATPSQAATLSPSASPSTADPTGPPRRAGVDVLAISVDGLNVDALLRLGRAGAPAYFRLLDGGAGTLNARTAVESTVTLPNHTTMLTGRRIEADRGGHGVTWNEDVPGSVVPGQGGGVESVFDQVHEAGGSTALFAGKDKFAVFERSWDDAIDGFEIDLDVDDLVAEVRADLAGERRRLRFLHLALPDTVAHLHGFMSPEYVAAVRRTDELLGSLLATIDATPRLHRRLVVVLTADHGGRPGDRDHGDAGSYDTYRVPLVVWGPRIEGADLYELNPDYRDPGSSQPSYDGPQPVRNGDLANLVTDLLGLEPVPGSELNAGQDLDVRPE